MTVYIDFDPYLADWFLNFCGCHGRWEAILPRGCVEGKILRVMLRAPRAGETPMSRCPEGWTAVRVPEFKGINLDSCNYLSRKGREAFKAAVRDRFDTDLWLSLGDFQLRKETRKDMLEAWMESRGIEDSETNTETIAKRLSRLSDRHLGAVRQKRFRSKNRP